MAECNTAVAQIDLTKVKPYGDTLNDGMTEVAKKMGLDEPNVVYSKAMTKEYTFFVVYGKCQHTVDYTTIKVAKVDVDVMDRLECAEYIKENIKRPVVIVGASTGTDAHTVGIDAIMNMKGFHGHFGLERYEGIEAYNYGSQVPNEDLIAHAKELKADAVLYPAVDCLVWKPVGRGLSALSRAWPCVRNCLVCISWLCRRAALPRLPL